MEIPNGFISVVALSKDRDLGLDIREGLVGVGENLNPKIGQAAPETKTGCRRSEISKQLGLSAAVSKTLIQVSQAFLMHSLPICF